MLNKLVRPSQLRNLEIHQHDGDDLWEAVLAVTDFQRLADVPRGVGDDPVLEELLARLLHLHDDVVVYRVGAEHVEDQSFVGVACPELLRRQIGQILNGSDIRWQDGVEEVDEYRRCM